MSIPTLDLYGDVIVIVAALLGTAGVIVIPVAFRHEYRKDPSPHGFAAGFAREVTVAPRLGRVALAVVLLAMLWDHAAGPKQVTTR